MPRLRVAALAVLVAATAAMLHVVAFLELAHSPPALRAYGPGAAWWNAAALAAVQLAMSAWLLGRAAQDARMGKVRPLSHPWSGLVPRAISFFLAADAVLLAAWLPTTLMVESVQVAVAAGLSLVGLVAHGHVRGTPTFLGLSARTKIA